MPFLKLLCLAPLALLCGCQVAYEYEVWGVIRDATTEKPLQDVRISMLEAEHNGNYLPTSSDQHGKFWSRYTIRDEEFAAQKPGSLPKRVLKISKDGYHDEEVDVSPMLEPDSANRPLRIVVVAYMRKR